MARRRSKLRHRLLLGAGSLVVIFAVLYALDRFGPRTAGELAVRPADADGAGAYTYVDAEIGPAETASDADPGETAAGPAAPPASGSTAGPVLEGAAGTRVDFPVPVPPEFEAEFEKNERLAEFHAALEREPRDADWAAPIEASLREYVDELIASGQFNIVSLECRSASCELLALGYGEDAWGRWNETMGRMFEDGRPEQWFEGPGQASCGGNAIAPGVYALNCTLRQGEPANRPTFSLDAPHAPGSGATRVPVADALVGMFESDRRLYEQHRRLEQESTDASWSASLEPRIAEYLSTVDSEVGLSALRIECRTSLCEVQMTALDDAAVREWLAGMPSFDELGWYDVEAHGLNAGGTDDGRVAIAWFLERRD